MKKNPCMFYEKNCDKITITPKAVLIKAKRTKGQF